MGVGGYWGSGRVQNFGPKSRHCCEIMDTIDIHIHEMNFKQVKNKDDIFWLDHVNIANKVYSLFQYSPMQIFVQILGSWKTISLQVKNTETIGVVKSKVEAKEGIPPEFNRLWFAGKWLQEDRKLSDYNISAESTLTLAINSHGGDNIDLYVKTLAGKTLCIQTSRLETVSDVKRKIQDRDGSPVCLQRLIFSGYQLEDDVPLFFYNISNHCTIHRVLLLRGGGAAVPGVTPGIVTVKYFKTLRFLTSCNLSTIADVKAEIEKQESYPVAAQRLILRGRVLDDDFVLGQRNLQLVLKIADSGEKDPEVSVQKRQCNEQTVCDDERDWEERPTKRIKLTPSSTENTPKHNLRNRRVY